MTRKTYKTMQGKEIDLEALRTRNELAIAVGNGKMNARGDKLGPGGVIEKKRDEVVAEYYETNPKAAVQQAPITETSAPTPPVAPVAQPQVEVKKKV
jgi:hypothetical protein